MGTGCTMPKNTCPTIDEIQEGISVAEEAIEKAKDALYGLQRQLEEVRTANSLLREAAETWQEEIDEVEAERDILQERLDAALAELEEMKNGQSIAA